MDCYVTIWKDVGCLAEGFDYPEKLSASQLSSFNDMNLLLVHFLNEFV